MNKLISCEFNIDTASVELKFTDGSILTRMENAELIERRQMNGNCRSPYVYLTDNGRVAAREMAPIFTDADEWAAQPLTEEETEQLKVLLGKVCSVGDSNA